MRFVVLIFCLSMGLPLSGWSGEKTIRLRNELIRTAAKSDQKSTPSNEESTGGLWLVQLEEGLLPTWKRDLEHQGAKVLKAIPEDAFLVELGKSNPAAIRKLPFVRWVGKYKPEHKVHSHLRAANGPVPVRILFKPGLTGEEKIR